MDDHASSQPSSAAASHQQQAHHAIARSDIGAAVLTISDTRTAHDDRSGDRIAEMLGEAGHPVHVRRIVRDEVEIIRAALREMLSDPRVRMVITTGGTGVAPRDVTPIAVREVITEELPGFGELFRWLSWQQIGSAAMLSRSLGGVVVRDGRNLDAGITRDAGIPGSPGDALLFALPGSTAAVELALRELIIPQAPHLLWLRRR